MSSYARVPQGDPEESDPGSVLAQRAMHGAGTLTEAERAFLEASAAERGVDTGERIARARDALAAIGIAWA